MGNACGAADGRRATVRRRIGHVDNPSRYELHLIAARPGETPSALARFEAMAHGARWWTGRADRTVSDVVAARSELVRDFYVDLHNIRHVHPLVVEVRAIDRRERVDGYVQTYRVRDLSLIHI